jgi:hypothetical protein
MSGKNYRKSPWKNYQVTFQIRSVVPSDLLHDGIVKQLVTPSVPNGFHLTPRETETLQMEEIPNVAPGQ